MSSSSVSFGGWTCSARASTELAAHRAAGSRCARPSASDFGDFGAASSCDWSAVVLLLAAGTSVSSAAVLRAAAAVVHIAAQSRSEIWPL